MTHRTFQASVSSREIPHCPTINCTLGEIRPCIAGNAKEAAADRARRMAPGVFVHTPWHPSSSTLTCFAHGGYKFEGTGGRRGEAPGYSEPRCCPTCGTAGQSKCHFKLFGEAGIGSLAACLHWDAILMSGLIVLQCIRVIQ